MPSTIVDCDQSQSGAVHPHALEEPMAKPLICSFFKRATATPSPPSLINGRGNLSSRVTNSAATTCRSIDGAANPTWGAAAATNHQFPFPPPMEEPIHLFPLTPSVKVPLRHSKRSGRVLNESETLQEKHAQEYRYIVPVLAYAIECTIAEHDVIRRSAGMPAYISSSSSPVSSPTRDGKEREDSGSDAAAERGQPHPNAADNAGDRNSVLGAKVFQAAINAFSTREVPTISVHDYLRRIVKYTYVSPSVLVCCCLYLDRLLAMYPSLLLHPHNIFKFLITSTRICSKVMDTRTLNNRDFSVVGGVTNEDINALEFMFVQLLQNRLYISHHTFDVYCDPLRRQAAHVDVEGEWDGMTLAMVLPTNGNRQGGYPHQPARPSLARNSGCGNGSVMSRSRRSSIVSQNEYSISMASQSGVSPLRSASRPAFPPSASMAQSISVEGEFLASARQPSAAPSRGESAAGTSGRRHPMGSSANMTNGTTSRSPVLPQVHQTTAAAANGGNNGVASAVPVIRNVNSAATLRSSGNFEDTISSSGLAQSATGNFMHQLQHATQASDAGDDNDDARARSIPVPGPRGFSSSWDAARTTRTLAATTGGGGYGLSSSVTATARSGSPNTLPGGSSSTGTVKNRSLEGVTLSTDGASTPGHISTPTRRAFVASSRGDGVALPPVPQSGRRGRSSSFAGNSGATIPNVPPPPEFRQRQ